MFELVNYDVTILYFSIEELNTRVKAIKKVAFKNLISNPRVSLNLKKGGCLDFIAYQSL